jgi:hypothetical protein
VYAFDKTNEIIVGNVGTVYRGSDEKLARANYNEYRSHSRGKTGRAAGEDVTWMRGDSVVREHTGRLSKLQS